MWPANAACACCFTFDFDAEEVWIGDDPANAERPGVLSQGTYGAKVGVPAILALLERHGLKATFFVPGRVAERYPEQVSQIVAARHELAHHGYTHTSPTALDASAEEAELVKGLDVLHAFTREVSGYRSPSWELTPVSLELVARHGLSYSSNLMDDICPYRHEKTGLVELPIHWMLDDAPHFWFDASGWTNKISTTADVRSIWEEELAGIRSMGGCFILTMHPQIIGRPSRLALLDSFIANVKRDDGIWIATAAEIAASL
jgi:peptidoglycan/xylan/chitin deacetylase (PgdA/CDA1 family)